MAQTTEITITSAYQQVVSINNNYFIQNMGNEKIEFIYSDTEPLVSARGHILRQLEHVNTSSGNGNIWARVSGGEGLLSVTLVGSFSKSFIQQVQEGLVAGYSFVSKYGENPDIDGVFEDIWDGGGTYLPPTTARIHNVKSTVITDAGTEISGGVVTSGGITTLIDTAATFQTDVVAIGDLVLNDSKTEIGLVSAIVSETELTIIGSMRSPKNGLNSLLGNEVGNAYRIARDASTGASVFYVQGLDINYNSIEEFVITNGTTDVATIGVYLRQFRARVFASASTGALGIITSTAVTDGTVTCQIIDGNNQTMMAIYTIPAGKIGYLKAVRAGLSKKQAASSIVRVRTGQLGGLGYVKNSVALSSTGSSIISTNLGLVLPAGADIWIEADASIADIGVTAGFDILLKDI